MELQGDRHVVAAEVELLTIKVHLRIIDGAILWSLRVGAADGVGTLCAVGVTENAHALLERCGGLCRPREGAEECDDEVEFLCHIAVGLKFRLQR